ncbi:MAG: hypothetical protein GX877_06555 [Bacteroidales bacterium]|nr:hypothetical protein [Bacteroidales bacterium]
MRKVYSLIFGLGVFLFFWLVLPYHLRFHEQFQFFRFGMDYFVDSALHPEGFSFYLSGFFVQFFRYPWAGALILALLLVLMQRLVAAIAYRAQSGAPGREFANAPDRKSANASGNPLWYPLTYLPSAFVWLLLCHENYMLSAVVALLLALGAIYLYQRAGNGKSRIALFYILQLVLFFLAGGVVVVFTSCFLYLEVFRLGNTGRNIDTRCWMVYAVRVLPAVALVFLYPMAARIFWQYPYAKLLGGIHFYRYYYFSYPVQYLAWVLAAAVPLVCRLIPAQASARIHRVISPVLWVLVATATAAGLYHVADKDKELLFAYDTLVYEERWEEVLQLAQKESPGSSLERVAVNLALWKTGRLPTELFHYSQEGTEGLLLTFRRDFFTPLIMSHVYLHLGMVNSAQRNAFDAMEAIPDFQKSARAYRQLARTNIINGHYRVAGSYLEQLSKTLFYRKWAQEAMQIIEDERRVEEHPEWGRIRGLRYKEEMLFSPEGLNAMLHILYDQNNDNRMAYDYMLAYTLLAKDLRSFARYVSLEYPVGNHKPLPVPYQEALVLYWVQDHPGPEGIPWEISEDVLQRLDQFTAMYSRFAGGRPERELKKDFGNTYWYYVFFTKI